MKLLSPIDKRGILPLIRMRFDEIQSRPLIVSALSRVIYLEGKGLLFVLFINKSSLYSKIWPLVYVAIAINKLPTNKFVPKWTSKKIQEVEYPYSTIDAFIMLRFSLVSFLKYVLLDHVSVLFNFESIIS